MVFSLWFGCVVAETHGYGSSRASAPTLAESGNSCRGTAGSFVVGSPEYLTGWTTSIGQVVYTRVLEKAHRWYGSEKAWPNWNLRNACIGAVDQQLSEDVRISMDVVSNEQLGNG